MTGGANAYLDRTDSSGHDPLEPAPAESAVPWQHLDIRVVWVNAAILLFSLGTGVVELIWFGGELWPLLVASAAGVLDTTLDLVRWLTTRYRITGERVEKRTGWLVREYRYVPMERIRNMDTTAKLRHRIAGLRIVHIGAGEARLAATFSLDAVTKDMAEQLRRDLIPDRQQEPDEREIVIARVRWYWVFYSMFQVWALLAAGLFLNACYWSLRSIRIDLIRIFEDLTTRAGLGVAWTVVLGVVVSLPIGAAVLGFEFIAKYWNFELVRTADKGGALITRQGLFSTQTVHREDSWTRGIHLHEPLLLRWMGLAQVKIVTTGVHKLRDETAHILPRCPVSEAKQAAKSVLPDGFLPLEAPLLRHPRGALYKRLLEATYSPAVLAGILAWLGATKLVPDWIWPIPLVILPVAWTLAVVAYRTLGHTLAGPYVVVRTGALVRSTVALQARAVAGWRLHQTIFQRLGNRMTVGIPTAAGHRYYHAPDAGVDQALAFIKGATPRLAADFIELVAPTNHPIDGGFGGSNATH